MRLSFAAFWTPQSTISEPFLSPCVRIDCNINFCLLLPPDIDFPPLALWLSSSFRQQELENSLSLPVFVQCPA